MGFLSNLLRKSIENPLNSENIPLFQDFGFFSRFFSISKNKNKIFEKIFFVHLDEKYFENQKSLKIREILEF